jgi:CO/xanthine dehydrogenase FAD-binding subunit
MDWYFPSRLDEVPSLLAKEGVLPHAGGTGLLRTGLKNVKGLVDLSALPLTGLRTSEGSIFLGSCNTFARTCKELKECDPGCILIKSLSMAASTPLRNRITLGGSIASFPLWSDLMGPLIALESEATVLLGSRKGRKFPVHEIAGKREVLGTGLITEVEYTQKWGLSWYYRQTRVAFDYPSFTISILMRTKGQTISESRIVVTGTKNRYTRLYELEDILNGCSLNNPDIAETPEKIEIPEFPSGGIHSGDRSARLCRIWLGRGLSEIQGRDSR